jgi:hypothetical protein
MSQATIACTSLLPTAQLHSEDIWQQDSLPSNKLTKPSAKVHGQYLTDPNGLSTLSLLVGAVVMILMAVAAAVADC